MKSRMKPLWIALACLLFGVSPSFALQRDEVALDELCAVFADVRREGFKGEDREVYLQANIKQRVTSHKVLTAYYSVLGFDREDRYDLFRKMAEVIIEGEWRCPAMRAVMQ